MKPNRFLLLFVPVLLLCAAASATAGVPAAQLEKVVSSLRVSGTIEVDPQGHVARYEIKDARAYDQAVLDLLARDIPRWTFEPVLVDGVARQARFEMFLRLQAKPLDDKRFEVGIASAAFGRKEAAAPHAEVSAGRLNPPNYPSDEFHRGVGGTVLVVLKIGAKGEVLDLVAEQTNLKAVGTPEQMEHWRKDFEDRALFAARHWRFHPPTAGPDAASPYWSVRVPVAYIPRGAKADAAVGEWESYVPGTRHRIPWATERELADTGVDALPGGGVFPLEQPLHLLTPLNAG
jgi:hypothetical protein